MDLNSLTLPASQRTVCALTYELVDFTKTYLQVSGSKLFMDQSKVMQEDIVVRVMVNGVSNLLIPIKVNCICGKEKLSVSGFNMTFFYSERESRMRIALSNFPPLIKSDIADCDVSHYNFTSDEEGKNT